MIPFLALANVGLVCWLSYPVSAPGILLLFVLVGAFTIPFEPTPQEMLLPVSLASLTCVLSFPDEAQEIWKHFVLRELILHFKILAESMTVRLLCHAIFKHLQNFMPEPFTALNPWMVSWVLEFYYWLGLVYVEDARRMERFRRRQERRAERERRRREGVRR